MALIAENQFPKFKGVSLQPCNLRGSLPGECQDDTPTRKSTDEQAGRSV